MMKLSRVMEMQPDNVILTTEKQAHEVNELYNWVVEHTMNMKYLGGRRYYIEDDEDAVLFKMRWGI